MRNSNFNYQPAVSQAAAAIIGGAVLLALIVTIFVKGI